MTGSETGSERGPLDHLSDDERARLAAMPPAERHECMDRLHRRHAAWIALRDTATEAAASIEAFADTVRHTIGRLDDLPDAAREEALDYLMAVSLRAEWARALARGDFQAAEEFERAATVHHERSTGFLLRREEH